MLPSRRGRGTSGEIAGAHFRAPLRAYNRWHDADGRIVRVAALVLGCSGPADTEERPHGNPPPQGEGTASLPASTPEPTVAPAPTRVPAAAEEERPDPLPNGEGTSAYDFAFSLFQGEEVLGGQELRLSEVSGKPIVLNFWARFCTPCWTEMPELQDFYEEYGEEVLLLGIDVGQFTGLGLPKDASKLLSSLGVSYPAGYTDDPQVVRNYGVRAMPTTVFITANGEVFRTWTGSITRERVTAITRDMLEEE